MGEQMGMLLFCSAGRFSMAGGLEVTQMSEPDNFLFFIIQMKLAQVSILCPAESPPHPL